jgi:hypothetical protein
MRCRNLIRDIPGLLRKPTDVTTRFGPGLGSEQDRRPYSPQCDRYKFGADICYNSVPIHGGIGHKLFPF